MDRMNEAKKYVGGNWDLVGRKVYNFMIEEGLLPNHRLLDIGCGSFRCGRFFIDYLKKGKYYGIDHNGWLIEEGIDMIGIEKITSKKVNIIINDSFDFFPMKRKVHFAIAKSVFTHLTKLKIKQCLDNLKGILKRDGVFYASVFIGDSSNNLKESHDNKKFKYSLEEIKELANGWSVESLGNRGCKRQTMLRFTLLK